MGAEKMVKMMEVVTVERMEMREVVMVEMVEMEVVMVEMNDVASVEVKVGGRHEMGTVKMVVAGVPRVR